MEFLLANEVLYIQGGSITPGDEPGLIQRLVRRGAKVDPLDFVGQSKRTLRVEAADLDLGPELTREYPHLTLLTADGDPILASRRADGDHRVFVGKSELNDKALTIIAGPCAVEDSKILREITSGVQASGATVLRGGAFKPRTSPYAFQGTKLDGLRLMHEIAQEFDLPTVSEVVDPRDVEAVSDLTDMLQIGARNAQNFSLLSEVGKSGQPVLLKRGFGCTIDEWLGAAEYILAEGNDQVVLCERGIRTFEPATRFTVDVSAIPILKQRTHLPVVVDPSHGTGAKNLVTSVALGAVAAGADGLLLDVHTRPDEALCDGFQALSFTELAELSTRAQAVYEAARVAHISTSNVMQSAGAV